jgi:hypothetical protein
MDDVRRFDRSKRQRFKSDVLMPQIHAMMRRNFEKGIHKRPRRLSTTMILTLAAITFFVVLLWPVG